MYQDLSFMKIPLPEDVLKLKNYGDYAGAQKMIRYFLEHKEIPNALRKRLEIEQEIIGVMGADEYPYTYDEALEITFIAPEDAAQRTVYFETELQPNQEFMVEYSFDYHINYVELDPKRVAGEQPDFCLEEQSPHIMFTPYLRELRDELAGDETNPVILARRFYDFVTTKVMYSFVREYFTIECIPEYCAVNLKGDCGVQALLFITLCRMSGIPARWQSGLYATDYYTGCHDWAQFYVAPYGWVFADLSFGGSAWRAGEIERWNYYFGNLDVFRMPANSEIQKAFVPEKKWLRIDPIDNQRGEFEYEDHGLRFSQVEVSQKLISMEDIEK